MDEFFTFREYMQNDGELTPSMEDYLEMIYRLSQDAGFTRIHDLAAALNVQPSSVSRMIRKLGETGYLNFEKYSVVRLSDKGRAVGEKLLLRHNLCQEFLSVLGVQQNLLEETEKVEHTLSSYTLERLAAFLSFIKTKPQLLQQYKKFYEEHFK